MQKKKEFNQCWVFVWLFVLCFVWLLFCVLLVFWGFLRLLVLWSLLEVTRCYCEKACGPEVQLQLGYTNRYWEHAWEKKHPANWKKEDCSSLTFTIFHVIHQWPRSNKWAKYLIVWKLSHNSMKFGTALQRKKKNL